MRQTAFDELGDEEVEEVEETQHTEHAIESEYALDIAAFSADYTEQVPVDGYVKMVFKVRASCY